MGSPGAGFGRQLAFIQSIAFTPKVGNHVWGGNRAQTAEHLLLSDLALSMCSWAKNTPVSTLGKELIPHSSLAETWILFQAAVNEISILLHRASRVCPALCDTLQQALSAAEALIGRKKEKKVAAASEHKWKLPSLARWGLWCGPPTVAIDP